MCYEILNSWELRVTLPKFCCSSSKIIKHKNKTIEEKEFDTLCSLTIPQVYTVEINFWVNVTQKLKEYILLLKKYYS